MPYVLNVTVEDSMGHGFPSLWRHYDLTVGATLVKEADVWSLVRYPTSERLAAAQASYRGGYSHTVSDEVATELSLAGFAAYLTEVL